MVAQVRGEEGVHARGAHVVEEAVAGAAADRDGPDQRVGVARDADALRGRGQPLRGAPGQLGEGHGVVELADPAEAPAAVRVGGVRHERTYDTEVERAREGVGDAGVGAVGVGVRDVQRDVVLDQVVDDPALEGGRRDRRRTPQVEGVVGDQELRSERDGLVGDLLDGVDGEEDPGDLRVGVSADRADRIPALGQIGGPQGVERGDDFRQTGHGERLPSRCARHVVRYVPLRRRYGKPRRGRRRRCASGPQSSYRRRVRSALSGGVCGCSRAERAVPRAPGGALALTGPTGHSTPAPALSGESGHRHPSV